MITGSHAIIYSAQPEADRAFLRDVLNLPHVDVGHGWLIFGLPSSEVAVHPVDAAEPSPPRHELYLLCDDADRFVAALRERGVTCSAISEQRWGRVTMITLPGGGVIGAYEPRHARPEGAK
jgi:hypothetical protein